jgi:hypothetical protein
MFQMKSINLSNTETRFLQILIILSLRIFGREDNLKFCVVPRYTHKPSFLKE